MIKHLLTSTALICIAAPAFAQDAPLVEEAQGDEIVVTAQNRTQNIQDVPIAINVVSGEALSEAGVTDFSAISRVAPVVQITTDTVYTRIAIRGVGTNSNDEAQDQSVAVNIDGEYINRSNVTNLSLFDLDRVEVLRGPQGTLYGRNSTGGAINFITRKPGTRFAADGSATYGNFNQITLEGGVDIPFGFGGLRLSGLFADRDGFNYHPNLDARSDDQHIAAGRASLRLEPASGLTVDLVGEYVKRETVIGAQAFINHNLAGFGPGATCNLNGFVEVAPLTPGIQCIPQNSQFLRTIDRDSYDAPRSGLSSQTQESIAARGRLVYDFGPAIVTYTGGYRHTDTTGSTTLAPNYRFIGFENTVETQSHELRLNGESGRFVWQTGAFYFNEKIEAERGLFNSAIGPRGSYITYFRRPLRSESLSFFGQVDIPLTETLTAVGGLRYTMDKRTARYQNYGFQLNSGPVRLTAPAPQIINLETDGNKLTWLAGLNYKPNSDTLIYAKASTGFKAGGFDSVGVYRPESNTAYEVGTKLNFGPASEHTFNLSGFYYNYADLQVAAVLNSALGPQVFNAGKATIWGIEAEAVIKLDENDTFNASVNYLNAKYDRLLAAYPVFCVGCADTSVGDLDTNPATITQPDLSGNTPPNSPRFIITAGYDHVFDLGDGTVTASAFTRFKSAYFLDFFNFRDSRQEAFTQTDLSLTYDSPGKNWSIQAFVRNVEDIRPINFSGFVAAGPDDISSWGFGAPRTYGVRVGFDF